MRRLLPIVFCVLPFTTAYAQEEGVKLSKEELQALLPNTEVMHVSKAGSVRRWKNEPDGAFVASTTNAKYGSVLGTQGGSARGTWRINDEGKYCVQIDWKREAEDWCAWLVKAADGSYYLNRVDPARKIELTK